MTTLDWVLWAIWISGALWFFGPLVWRKMPALPTPPSVATARVQAQVDALHPKHQTPSIPRAFVNLAHALQAEGVYFGSSDPPQLILDQLQWHNFRYAMMRDPLMWRDSLEPEAVTFQRTTIGGIVVRVARPSDS